MCLTLILIKSFFFLFFLHTLKHQHWGGVVEKALPPPPISDKIAVLSKQYFSLELNIFFNETNEIKQVLNNTSMINK